MPYRNSGLNEKNPTYTSLATLPYDNNFTLEQHMDSMRHIFDRPQFSASWLEDTIRDIHPTFSLSQIDRSKEARAQRAALSREAQDSMMSLLLSYKQYGASKNTDNPQPGVRLNRPWAAFIRPSGEPEDLGFNRNLEMHASENDPAASAKLLFEELQRCAKAANIERVEDIYALINASDREIVEKYPQIRRFLNLMTEAKDLLSRKELAFNDEQKKWLLDLVNPAQDLSYVTVERMNMIASPLYEELGSELALSRKMSDLQEHMYNACAEIEDPMMTKVHSYFSGANSLQVMLGEGLMDRFKSANPELQDAIFAAAGSNPEMKPSEAFNEMLPVVARTPEAGIKVLVPGIPGKVLDNTAFMDQLSTLTVQADKWLLTGSRQFADMQKALKELNEVCKGNPDPRQLTESTEALRTAAETYLAYKGIKSPYDASNVLLKGKNHREQSRMDVASSILGFAKAQGTALSKEFAPKAEQVEQKQDVVAQGENVVPGGGVQLPPQNNWQEDLQVNTAQAKDRLDRYMKGTLKPSDSRFPGSKSAYLKHVSDDVSALAFQEALAIEDGVMKGKGVFQTLLKEQGYEKAFGEFNKAVRTTHAFVKTGLQSNQKDPVTKYLNEDGPKKLASNVLQAKPKVYNKQQEAAELNANKNSLNLDDPQIQVPKNMG